MYDNLFNLLENIIPPQQKYHGNSINLDTRGNNDWWLLKAYVLIAEFYHKLPIRSPKINSQGARINPNKS